MTRKFRRREILILGYAAAGSILLKEVTSVIAKIKKALPNGGIIYNSLNGDTNVAFFKQLQGAGMTAEKYPSMSVSIAEEEVQSIGAQYLKW